MLEAKNLSCVRDERTLFSALSFTVKPGDIIQVEGPNGAGKPACCAFWRAWRDRKAEKSAGTGKIRCVIANVIIRICYSSAISRGLKPC